MAIDALISGRIHKPPQSRLSANGKRFCTTVLRATARDGNGIFVSVIAFSQTACDVLLALDEGDSVALAGELTPKIYTPRDGSEPRPSLDLVAHKVLTEYHIARKRKAVSESRSSECDRTADPHEGESRELDDALPF